jgi:RNA 3'-terminal phosphate cyclase
MALAAGPSRLATCRVTEHLLTNAHLIRQILPVRVEVAGEVDELGEVRVTR